MKQEIANAMYLKEERKRERVPGKKAEILIPT